MLFAFCASIQSNMNDNW